MGGAEADFVSAMIACFWRIDEAFSIDIWLGRVRAKLNLENILTGNTAPPFKVGRKDEFSSLRQLQLLQLKLHRYIRTA